MRAFGVIFLTGRLTAPLSLASAPEPASLT